MGRQKSKPDFFVFVFLGFHDDGSAKSKPDFFMFVKQAIYKVNRCLARYSPRATTTSQPINRAPNEPAMARNAIFGPNLVVSGQKILFLLEKSKVLLLT